MSRFDFQLQKNDGDARAGKLEFSSGLTIETPIFMPVGTVGSVKSLSQADLIEMGYQLILANTYHIYLRPGTEVLQNFDGLKNFMNWPNVLLTDSGGFQAFSLSEFSKYKPDGVEFRSHIDGSKHFFSPEKVLDIQATIGADIVMPIDDCAAYPASVERLEEGLTRTHKWLEMSKKIWLDKGYSENQSLFGIIQGGVNPELRKRSAEFIAGLDLPGTSIGGLSVGEKGDEFLKALAINCQIVDKKKPRYLMGVGSIPEILNSVKLGIDMFDCVLPTRNARNGQVFTSTGKVNLRNEKYKNSKLPIDESCDCKVCYNHNLGYIRHLHKVQEITALSLSSYHNLYFMKTFMSKIRTSILEENFASFYEEWMPKFV